MDFPPEPIGVDSPNHPGWVFLRTGLPEDGFGDFISEMVICIAVPRMHGYERVEERI